MSFIHNSSRLCAACCTPSSLSTRTAEANVAIGLSAAKHAYHSILSQLPDIGQDELIFEDLLYRALSQLIAWYAISCWVLAYLNSTAGKVDVSVHSTARMADFASHVVSICHCFKQPSCMRHHLSVH